MAPIWTSAVQMTGLEGRFRVVELPPTPSELPRLLEGAAVLLLDVPSPDVIPLGSGAPGTVVCLMRTPLSPTLFEDSGYREYRAFDFAAELYGAHMISHLRICIGARRNVEMLPRVAMPQATGPGAGPEGQLALWNAEDFVGRGVRVSRDDPAVIEETFRATVGQAPLWVQPQFPFLVPRAPSTFKSLDGETVQGLLCSSHERAGGWVVLTRRDVLDLLGHPAEVPWSRIPDLIGVQAAAALLSWLASSVTPASGT